MKTTNSKKLVSKKVLIPAILGIGILLSAIFVASPLGNSWAQQQQQRQLTGTNNTNIREYDTVPKINGSVSVEDNIRSFLEENTKIPFVSAAEIAQKQIANGTVLGGHLGVTQGYLTYTYIIVDQAKETIHKVIIDAGNGQALYVSDGRQIDSFSHPMFGSFGHGKAHGFGGGPWHGFGGFWHGSFR
ncbi:MAG: hypothetical protein K0S67_1692 [Nitrososphaeraceae archaeon]|jgi:uncharacterized membrane protein YkoI|nr:hypothetical protein [Nitrososphaeraceae archaeon]MDF2768749.1 hypothetical protein [Nitrososphaeraceae archaeon]